MSQRARVSVRAARPGEGRAIAALWRELWDAHEAWGGYAGCQDDRMYEKLAARLDDDARARAGQPILRRHIHVVAVVDGAIAGQVEGWVERSGVDPSTPYTCEVRSLIVTSWARGNGVGGALLAGLAESAALIARGTPLVLGAEVLEPNPAHGFYTRLGYVPVSWSLRIDGDLRARVPASARPASGETFAARPAEPRDALALSVLDAALAQRRRVAGDVRYDRPRAVDAATVAAIAAQVAEAAAAFDRGSGGSLELVTVDGQGRVRAAATFAVSTLEPPFLPAKRAVLGRFASDPALDAAIVVAPLIALGQELTARANARFAELTEVSPPSSPLHAAATAAGAVPWSRIVTRPHPGRHG